MIGPDASCTPFALFRRFEDGGRFLEQPDAQVSLLCNVLPDVSSDAQR